MSCSKSLEKDKLNSRPIIAVLAQQYPTIGHHSYIAASYIKYLECAGARVVPIPHSMSLSTVEEIFPYINGVLLPGGGAEMLTSHYYKHAKQFWDLAIKANDSGTYFPVWGTCLGFEAIHVTLMNSENVLSPRSAQDISFPLKYTAVAKDSKLFTGISKDLLNALGNEDLTYNHHDSGVAPETYQSTPLLRNFFKILSTNFDDKGQEFISTIEAYNYPIYGVQWHPEKNTFEFTIHSKKIPHSSNAVKVTQYMANFFVDEARRNPQTFPTKDMEDKYLIYRYTPIHSALKYTTGTLSNMEQVYLF